MNSFPSCANIEQIVFFQESHSESFLTQKILDIEENLYVTINANLNASEAWCTMTVAFRCVLGLKGGELHGIHSCFQFGVWKEAAFKRWKPESSLTPSCQG